MNEMNEINMFFSDLDSMYDAKINCINYYKTKNLVFLYFDLYSNELKHMYNNDDDDDYPKIIAIYKHNDKIHVNCGEMYNYVDEGCLGYECHMTTEQIFDFENIENFKKHISACKFNVRSICEPLFSSNNIEETKEAAEIFDDVFFNIV